MGYPEYPTIEDKNNYKQFFILFSKLIPCPLCAKHFQDNLIKYPLDDEVMSSKENLIKWTIIMHNQVNKKNNKKEYSFQEGMKMIFDGSQPYDCNVYCNNEGFSKSNKYNYKECIIVVLIIFIIILLFLKK